MFNPEKLLGGLMRSGMRGGGGRLVTGGAALGLVGVAMEAVEHFMNQSSQSSTTPASGGPPSPPGAASPPMPPGAAPPPPPGTPAVAPPPPPPGTSQTANRATDADSDAVLLIRAMIAAANADGVIDAQERASILDTLQRVDLSEEERTFIIHELLAPKGLQDIVDQVQSDEMARQVYLVSRMAIEVDTQEERDYLRQLAHALGLDNDTINGIHQQLGIPSGKALGA